YSCLAAPTGDSPFTIHQSPAMTGKHVHQGFHRVAQLVNRRRIAPELVGERFRNAQSYGAQVASMRGQCDEHASLVRGVASTGDEAARRHALEQWRQRAGIYIQALSELTDADRRAFP